MRREIPEGSGGEEDSIRITKVKWRVNDEMESKKGQEEKRVDNYGSKLCQKK